MNDSYFPAFSSCFKESVAQLKGKQVAIVGHIRPDGDCIGSQVGLCRILNSLGVNTVAINHHPIPTNLRTFVGDTPFEDNVDSISNRFDHIISVDCSATNRMGEAFESQIETIEICIDHHVSNKGFADQNWIDSDAAATAEIITGMVIDNGIAIDETTAMALYVGIATDTGQFRYAATTERVFKLTSHLVKNGANAHEAAHELYERESMGRVTLLQQFLNTLQAHHEDRFMFGIIKQEMFDSTGTTREDTEGFIDYARNIDSVEIAALLEQQKDGSVKGSLRSKFPEFEVDKLAGQFNGGGHACAAGFHSDASLETFLPIFIGKVKSHLDSIEG